VVFITTISNVSYDFMSLIQKFGPDVVPNEMTASEQ